MDKKATKKFRKEYKERLTGFEEEVKTQMVKLSEVEQQREELAAEEPNIVRVTEMAKKAIEGLRKKDMKALRNVYGSLFENIIVGPQKKSGCRVLRFVLNDHEGPDYLGPSGPTWWRTHFGANKEVVETIRSF